MIYVDYAYFCPHQVFSSECRLERNTVKRKRVFATLKVLGTVLEQLSKEIPDEVQAAVSALKYYSGLPELPRGYFIPPTRNANMFDFLQCTFGFQVYIQGFPCVAKSNLV
ncbi:callose synthase 9-like [Cajanus cajan]|uniref:callose synthase 9-like n=1 Tax=Cajanus cajan TaxID=3821 RepID=UPI00098DA2AB|nr:callose synthase 9-like [Cajanus cajan]